MKVFLSSTYIDLVEYRKAAHDALERLGQEVGRMEVFGAHNEEAKVVALDQMEKCRLVIGIYAHRYGFIPEGSDISITEQEYVYAKSKGKPILCFIVDEDIPWSPKMMEKDVGKINKLEDFKAKVLKEKVVDFFTTPADLAMKIATSVHNYLEGHKFSEETFSLNGRVTNDESKRGSTLPAQPFFFGREKELETIADAILPNSRTWGILIYGEGGIGKTALAIEAAHRAPSTTFEIKIFVSAKERELTSKGEISSKEFSQGSYLSILNEISLQLGEEGIPRLAPDERANALKLVLQTKRTLLILDNLETLKNDDRDHLYQFLTYLPPGNKAIITNRRRDEVDGRIIRLDQLQRVEAEELISELAKRNPRLNVVEEIEKEELFYAASGNPLIIRWLVGQVGRDETNIKTIAEAIKFMKQAPRNNDPLEYVFGDLLNSLFPRERSILAIMVHLHASPKIDWIANIIDYNKTEIEMIWEELANRSIIAITKETKEYFLPHITRQFIKNKLPKEVAEAEKRLAHYTFRIILEFGGKKNTQEQENLVKNWTPIFASLPYFIKHDNEKLQIVCDALDSFLGSSQLLDEWLWLNQQAEIVAFANNDYDNAGARAYKVGLIYSYRGQSDEVLLYAKRAENNWSELHFTAKNSNSTKPLVNFLRAIGYKLERNYSRAVKEINDAIKIWKSFTPERIELANSYNELGEIQMGMGESSDPDVNYSNAEKNISEALRIANNNSYKEVKPKYTGNLAQLALKCGDWTKAIILANEAIIEAQDIRRQDEIAKGNFILASAYLQLGYAGDKGLAASREAVEIYTRLRHKDLLIAEDLLEQWRRKTGRRI